MFGVLLATLVELIPVKDITLNLHDEPEYHSKKETGTRNNDKNLDHFHEKSALKNVSQACLIFELHNLIVFVNRVFVSLLLFLKLLFFLFLNLFLNTMLDTVFVHLLVVHDVEVFETSFQTKELNYVKKVLSVPVKSQHLEWDQGHDVVEELSLGVV